MSSERGFTLVELLVAMAASIVVLLGIFGLVDVSTRSSARVASHVEADQRARPVMQRLIDELHSTCVGPNTQPVLAGSGDSALTFLARTGSAVTPVPDKHVVTLAGGTLTESIFPATNSSAPWTFATSASSTTQLLTNVGAASLGSPPSSVPAFQYFGYQGAQLSTTPLPTPLIATDAARATEVTVSFSVAPLTTPVADQHAAVTVSDSAILRLSPASENSSDVNPPCA